MATNSEAYYLGIDVGTTSVKVSLSRVTDGKLSVLKSYSRDTGADIWNATPEIREQSPYKVISTLLQCLADLGVELANSVSMGVCGQMHGVVLWKRDLVWADVCSGEKFGSKVNNLITWEDRRCDDTFLSSLPIPTSGYKLCSGFGCCSLAWLARNSPASIAEYHLSGTIMDLLVYLLCKLSTAVTSEQCAYSWGYYNPVRREWDTEQLSSVGVDLTLLPRVLSTSVAGTLSVDLSGLKLGIPISVGFGDLQCSVLSAGPSPADLVVNIGTSAQAVLLRERREQETPGGAVTAVPYFGGCDILVAASLNGGNVIAKFVELLDSWSRELGGSGFEKESVYERLIDSGMRSLGTDLSVSPVLFGERHSPGMKASVCNIVAGNLSLGCVSSALCRGVVENLATMMSPDTVRSRGVLRLIGCGSVLERNKLVQEHLKRVYELPISLAGPDTSAALGASIAMFKETSDITC